MDEGSHPSNLDSHWMSYYSSSQFNIPTKRRNGSDVDSPHVLFSSQERSYRTLIRPIFQKKILLTYLQIVNDIKNMTQGKLQKSVIPMQQQYRLVLVDTCCYWVSMEWYWLIYNGTGSVEGGTG